MITSRTRRCALIRAAGLCGVLALAAGACGGGAPAPEQQASSGPQVQVLDAQGAPVFRVDPFWPKPLPNKWSMQQIVDHRCRPGRSRLDHQSPCDARPDEVGAGCNPPRLNAASSGR